MLETGIYSPHSSEQPEFLYFQKIFYNQQKNVEQNVEFVTTIVDVLTQFMMKRMMLAPGNCSIGSAVWCVLLLITF